jgi:hypothetical protein
MIVVFFYKKKNRLHVSTRVTLLPLPPLPSVGAHSVLQMAQQSARMQQLEANFRATKPVECFCLVPVCLSLLVARVGCALLIARCLFAAAIAFVVSCCCRFVEFLCLVLVCRALSFVFAASSRH